MREKPRTKTARQEATAWAARFASERRPTLKGLSDIILRGFREGYCAALTKGGFNDR